MGPATEHLGGCLVSPRRWAWAVPTALLACGVALAQPEFLSLDQRMGPEPESSTRRFPFVVQESQTKLFFDTKATLTTGHLTLRILDPQGAVLREDGTGEQLIVQGSVPTQAHGTFQLEVIAEDAVGKWKAQVCPLLPPSAFRLGLITGPAMVVVAGASVLYWRARSRALWCWFWVGAGVWAIGVALKVGCALLVNGPVLQGLEKSLPATWYLVGGALYVGLLTGVFEIGVTLGLALYWRKMAADAPRAVAVGVGAGAFEALLLGLGGVAFAVLLVSGKAPDVLVAQGSQLLAVTPLAWLTGPVERLIAILCHTSSRALTLLTVATGRWRYFWWGFVLMTVLDGIAGLFLLSNKVATISTWWIELAIVPAAVVSVPIIRWCVSHWPAAAAAPPGVAPESPNPQPSA